MRLHRFLHNERGTTAIEYAVIGALIFLVIISAIQPIGATLAAVFGQAGSGLSG